MGPQQYAAMKDRDGDAQRESQVRRELDDLARSVMAMQETTSRLEDRLNPVLGMVPPATIEKKPEGGSRVPLAEEINLHKNKIVLITVHLHTILSRLEI